MKAIGGYFELELSKKAEYHQEAIRLNTGRNALEYILLVNVYSKVYVPFFTCEVLLEPLHKHKIAYEFYCINEQFEPVFDYNKIKSNEAFLYTNYFGLKDSFIILLVKICKNVVIDSSQSFFSKPVKGIDTFYSARKFFGVPDGAYLYSTKKLPVILKKDISFDRFSHLLKRLDCGAEKGYEDFVFNDSNLNHQDIKEMSILTKSLLKTIDYKFCIKKRKSNFDFLNKNLKNTNKLILNSFPEAPMVYPYWSEKENLRLKLIDHKIFTPVYWDNVLKWAKKDSLEYGMTKQVIYLPIDHRYDQTEMENIIHLL